jgi:hypothetical protein
MGLEATCRATIGRRSALVDAHLDKEVLQLRGAIRSDVPLAELSGVTAMGGILKANWKKARLTLALGGAAERWALKIRYPRSRIEKLGLKAGLAFAVDGINEPSFATELAAHDLAPNSKSRTARDMILWGAEDAKRLVGFAKLRSRLAPTGALWIVYPKGQKHITEAMVRAAGKKAGLVDVKVMSFSDRLTALKFMIPRSAR